MNTASPPDKKRMTRRKSVLFGFAEEIRRQGKKPKLQWRWGRILATLIMVMVGTYGLLTTALYYYYKERRQFQELSWSQVLSWPLKREAFRRSMGEYFIKRSREEFKERNFSEGFYYLRAGVARAPADLEARQFMAEIYEYTIRRADLAVEVMEKGFPYAGYDEHYLNAYLGILLRNQLDQKIIDFAQSAFHTDGYIQEPDPIAPENKYSVEDKRRWMTILSLAAIQACIHQGNYDQAEDILTRMSLGETPAGFYLQSQLEWKRGRNGQAISILENGLEKYPGHDRFLRQLYHFHLQLGNPEQARRYGIRRVVNNPDDPIPKIDLLHFYNDTGDIQRVRAELTGLLRKFPDDEKVHTLIGNFAAETGRESIARNLYNLVIQNNNGDVSRFALFLLEAQIVNGNNEGAIAFCEELVEENPDWLSSRMTLFNSLRAVAYFSAGRGDLGQLYLGELLSEGTLHAETLRVLSKRLRKIGRERKAIEVLNIAYEKNPENQAALSDLIMAKIASGETSDLPRLVHGLLRMRKPSTTLLKAVYREIGQDRYLFMPTQKTLLNELKDSLGSPG